MTRPTWTEFLAMDLAMASAVFEHLKPVEDGLDLKYLAAVLGRKGD